MSCDTEDVTPFTPTVGTFTVPAKQIGSAPFVLTPPSSNSTGSFSYTSSDPSVATISGSTVTIVGIGNTTITAIQAADVRYASSTATAVFTVTQLPPPTIGAFTVPSKAVGSAPFQLTAPLSNSGGAFSYTSSNANVATINGTTVTVVGVGTSTITATQAAFGSYASGSVTATLTVTNFPIATIASDNFDGAVGSALTSSGWVAHSSAATNPILTITPGLTFPNYYGAGMGNAAAVNSTGQDVSLQFTEVNSGTVYASFLVNATASPACIDQYFFAFGNNAITDTAFRGKVLINQDATNPSKFKFGFAANLTLRYTTNLFDYGTTYLVVVKYKIVDAATTNSNGNLGRDESSLYIFDASSNYLTEPSVPTIGIEDTGSADIIPGRVVLRQDNTNSPNVIIDGLRVDNTWNLRN
ncbi:MAG: hypothetical protein CFE24_09760 [Flavobacterium sp. BFFFF2]|nr:MAG: hypothetical protein CFE24_09760 [Flavobacterium sp. BFFFF2]